MWQKISHQYMFICHRCKEIIFNPQMEKIYCSICDKEIPCIVYIPQKYINKIRENIKKYWKIGD